LDHPAHVDCSWWTIARD